MWHLTVKFKPIKLDLKDIMEFVEEYYKLSPGAILTNTRTKTIAKAKAVCQYLQREYTKYSFHEIADFYQNDSSSVIHNCHRIKSILINSEVHRENLDVCDAVNNLQKEMHEFINKRARISLDNQEDIISTVRKYSDDKSVEKLSWRHNND